MLASTQVIATDYTKNTTISENPYVITNDTINGYGTVVNAQDVIIGDTQNGNFVISNSQSINPLSPQQTIESPTFNVNTITLGNQQGAVGKFSVNDISTINRVATRVTTNIADDMIVGNSGSGELTR